MLKKGYITLKKYHDSNKYFVLFEWELNDHLFSCEELRDDKDIIKKLITNNRSDLENYKEGINDSLDKSLKTLANKIFDDYLNINSTDCRYILYDEFVGNDGNYYGKELITGLIFPIDNKKIRDNKYIFHGSYTDIYNEHSFYVEKIEIGFNNSSMSSIEGFIINGEIANQNDKDEYLKKYSSYFKKNKLIKALNYIYNSNVFTSDPTYKEEQENVDKIELSEETKVMESIEYHLQILDSINHEKYILLKNKYEELLNSNDLLNINSLNLSSLILLDSEIEIEIRYCKRNANNIKEYLLDYKREYLNNLLNDGLTTQINLKDLDTFFKLFSNIKNNFSILDQREIINGIAFIYLMEIYENRDLLSVELLKNTYVKEIIKSIIINLKSLINLDIFKGNLNLELLDNIDLNSLLIIIKNIEVSDKTKIKKLIKE